jgi:hypothetical protein
MNRPGSSSLSKYRALPQIGAKIDLSQYSRSSSGLSNFEFVESNDSQISNDEILVGFRLPNGTKRQRKFTANTRINEVLNYATSEMKVEAGQIFTLLQMPNFIIDDLDKTLNYYKIQDRSMLFVIDKSLL